MVLFDDAISLLEGIGRQQDIEEGISVMIKIANEGNCDAQFCLARFYWDGQYVEQNDEKTIYWYTKSAENGHPFSQHWLGNNYMNGTKTAIDYEKAVFWYTKAAENGIAMAYYNLGMCYYWGLGIEQDRIEGERLIREAADRNVLVADLTLLENQKYNDGHDEMQKKVLEKYGHLIGKDREVTKGLADACCKGYGLNADKEKAYVLYCSEILDGDEQALYMRLKLGEKSND